MDIGIGLPNTLPGTSGVRLIDWARRAEERGFTCLTTIDRVVYPTYDSLVALAGVAGATTRIGLVTNILIAPLHSPVMLAKAAASLDQVSQGRLTLGLATGGRPDDYAAAGREFHTRGRAFDEALATLHDAWRGEPVAGSDLSVCPPPVHDQRVPILVGGFGDHSIRRTVEWGAGWTSGGATPEQAGPFAARVRDAWQQAGRPGEPRIAALNYFSLGGDDTSRKYLQHYYTFLGEYADMIAEGALRSEQAIRDTVRAFEDAGFTELYLDPTVAELDQVDRLADIVLSR